MSNQKHTFGNLKVSSLIPGDEYSTVILGGQHNGVIAKTEANIYNDYDFEVAEANAQEIVKRWNCHNELLEACKNMAGAIDNLFIMHGAALAVAVDQETRNMLSAYRVAGKNAIRKATNK